MEFNAEKAKGILDRSFPSLKIPLHKECSYTDLNNKCKQYVWADSSDTNYTYYMADGSGTGIGSCSFNIDLKDSRKTVLPWTLENYLRVSSVKYPSKLRLYCVRKLTPGRSTFNFTIMTVLIVEGSLCVADSTSEGEADDSDGDIVHVNSDVASISGQFSFIPPRGNLFYLCSEPAGYFEVLFYVPKRSQYRDVTSFRTMNQQTFLYEYDMEDLRTPHIRDVVDKNPVKYHLFQDNPLSEGCYLHSITCGESKFLFKHLQYYIIMPCPCRRT